MEPTTEEPIEVVAFFDFIKRPMLAELVEKTDEILKVKNPVSLGQQTDYIRDKEGRPLVHEETGRVRERIIFNLIPILFSEVLEDPEEGNILNYRLCDIEISENFKDAYKEQYRKSFIENIPEVVVEDDDIINLND